MPRTRECDFCGGDIEPGTGTMFVQNDGTTVDFCSSKCEKNADLGREARDVEWTAAGRAAAGDGTETVGNAEPETEEPSADTAEPEEPAATEGDVVEDTGAAPDLEDAEADDAPGPEGEGASEAAADGDTDQDVSSAETAEEADEATADDADDDEDEETEEEEAEA